jgi:hypothetical protein
MTEVTVVNRIQKVETASCIQGFTLEMHEKLVQADHNTDTPQTLQVLQ